MKVFTYQCGCKFSDSDIPCFPCNGKLHLADLQRTSKGNRASPHDRHTCEAAN